MGGRCRARFHDRTQREPRQVSDDRVVQVGATDHRRRDLPAGVVASLAMSLLADLLVPLLGVLLKHDESPAIPATYPRQAAYSPMEAQGLT
jgi:hypothetical protein